MDGAGLASTIRPSTSRRMRCTFIFTFAFLLVHASPVLLALAEGESLLAVQMQCSTCGSSLTPPSDSFIFAGSFWTLNCAIVRFGTLDKGQRCSPAGQVSAVDHCAGSGYHRQENAHCPEKMAFSPRLTMRLSSR